MLWCETGSADARAIERLAVFVSQLGALGIRAGIDVRAVPEGLHRTVRYDLAPYLLDRPVEAGDRVAIVAADRLSEAKLSDLRRLAGDRPRGCVAFGRFGSREAIAGLRARLAGRFDAEPRIVDLADHGAPGSGPELECPVFGVPPRDRPGAPTRPRLLVVGPALDEPGPAAALSALALSRRITLAVLTDGEAKQRWLAVRGAGIAVYSYGELLPAALAGRVDILACMAPPGMNYRLHCLVANLAVAGAALLDCTRDHAIASEAGVFIRGPSDLAGLEAFVRAEIVPNLDDLASHARQSPDAQRLGGARRAALLGDDAPPAGKAGGAVLNIGRRGARPPTARVLFLPTNGVGLGHAQRCTLVAAELDRDRLDPRFAAFPSCVGLVKGYGFDVAPLVQRSGLHAAPHENDLVNYLRLRGLAAGATALVFDGSYVFESIYRTIVEHGLAGIWLRRELWQAGQDNRVALDRGKVFSRIIVPTEAFDELNADAAPDDRLHRVGPIVQRHGLGAAPRELVRAGLARRFGLSFERLVVTQLGSGVAADRGPQIQALCGMMERRSDVLHLVLVWPMAALQPGWFGWSRSRVVRTPNAHALAAAADLCISAAGYNSFHEIIYGALPAILIPQAAPMLDDQTARARAARDRNLAWLVAPHELMALDRAVVRFLDEGEGEATRRRLAALELPEPGNRRAAALIAELADARPSSDRIVAANRSAPRL